MNLLTAVDAIATFALSAMGYVRNNTVFIVISAVLRMFQVKITPCYDLLTRANHLYSAHKPNTNAAGFKRTKIRSYWITKIYDIALNPSNLSLHLSLNPLILKLLLQGVCGGIIDCASFAIAARLFPKQMVLVTALVQSTINTAIAVSPFIGAVLYEVRRSVIAGNILRLS